MPVRRANAVWEGGIKDGEGRVALGSGAFEGRYSFGSRFCPVSRALAGTEITLQARLVS